MNTQPLVRPQKWGYPPPRSVLSRALDILAVEDDRTDSAPIQGLKYLSAAGASQAVLPSAMGGVELGWSPGSSSLLAEWLRSIGSTHLSLARLYEGHVNAFQLIWVYGSPAQRHAVCRYVAEGGWLGVWNAPHASGPLQLHGGGDQRLVLHGKKAYASGAGLIDRPLITAQHPEWGYVMLWPRTDYQVGPKHEWEMHGMRASVTFSIQYQHAVVSEDDIVGQGDDYHREPLFTTGAWRFLAAQLGAGERLVELMAYSLNKARRDGDPHQRARMGEAAIALETASLWLERARSAAIDTTQAAEGPHLVRMARLAIEQQLLNIVLHAQRSIGLRAFRRDNPVERIIRDLSTYLRQPAPDLARDQVGAHAMTHCMGHRQKADAVASVVGRQPAPEARQDRSS